MTRIEELNKKINTNGFICGKDWSGLYAICGSYDGSQIVNGQILGVHHNIESFDTLNEMETTINDKY